MYVYLYVHVVHVRSVVSPTTQPIFGVLLQFVEFQDFNFN